MDKKKMTKYLKFAIVVIVVALFLWFLVLGPLFTFKIGRASCRERV